ncbi:hypothetical protein JVU11DRAFT_11987 [Chiua virens]|nr:hypothetical protein JVU11DRAFT_11987 [Chiua virens]
MSPKKLQSVPAFYSTDAPPQLPQLSSHVQMIQTVSLVAVTATTQLATPKPAALVLSTTRAATPGPHSAAPPFQLAPTLSRTTTPPPPPGAKGKGVAFAASTEAWPHSDYERSEHSPAPSDSSLSSLESDATLQRL